MKTVLQNIPSATESEVRANRIYYDTNTLFSTATVVPNDLYLGNHINSSIGCRIESLEQRTWPPIQKPDEYVVVYPQGQYSEPVTDESTSEITRVKDVRLAAILHEILGPDPSE